jgi:hypothetical protein
MIGDGLRWCLIATKWNPRGTYQGALQRDERAKPRSIDRAGAGGQKIKMVRQSLIAFGIVLVAATGTLAKKDLLLRLQRLNKSSWRWSGLT